MELRDFADLIGKQRRLDEPAKSIQKAVARTYAALGPNGQKLANVLNGVWLGHPLHPVLTDVPIGAWTTGLMLDALEALSGDERVGVGADAAAGLGVAAALAAAVAGLTDWQHTDGRPRRTGLVHAGLNVTATGVYAVSLVFRRAGRRGAGRFVALAGYAIMTASAYLGGDMVYGDQIGVDHAAELNPPRDFTPVLPETGLPEGALRRVDAGGVPVMLARRGGQIYALVATCSHLGSPLDEGQLEDDSVICPRHGSRFALADGRVLDGPATHWQPCLETRVRDGLIEVRAGCAAGGARAGRVAASVAGNGHVSVPGEAPQSEPQPPRSGL